MRLSRNFHFAVAALALGISACRDEAAPIETDPGLVAGTYVLESVSGRGPLAGTFVLTGAAHAERRVQYSTPAGALSSEYVATGTFTLRSTDTLEFALREDDGRSVNIWRFRGNRTGDRFTVRLPDPADGPDIVEIYRRR
jgi:hypothetical protein